MPTSLWTRNNQGVILDSLGKAVVCDECPCGGIETIAECDECPDGMARCWEFTIAGVTDFNCTGCNAWNGTFIVEHLIACRFESSYAITVPSRSGFCNTGNMFWDFRHQSGGFWQLVGTHDGPVASSVINHTIDDEDFNCLGDNVLSLAGGGTACQTKPATITISPVECP